MPTQMIQASLNSISNYNNEDNWTDYLERCTYSGIGFLMNQRYREDCTSFGEHEYEDRSLNFSLDDKNNSFLYAIFDGHDGSTASNFAAQKLPAELVFGQLDGKISEIDVREAFLQCFLSIEKAFLESIDPKIAERAQLLEKIPNSVRQFDALQQYPDTFSRLQVLEKELRSGTTCSVALIHNGMLYVGNVGDSRILLCQKDKNGVLKVKPLTIDHTTSSYEELQRLSDLSLDIDKIKGINLGSHHVTRCIGNYFLKGGYKEHTVMGAASAEPLISEPFIMSMPLDESCSFLILMSYGLYKSYEEATNSKQINKEIATMVIEQFLEQSTLTSVAQSVVDKVARMHQDAFLTKKMTVNKREDITLVIRNFTFKMSVQSQANPLIAQNASEISISSEEATVCDDLCIAEVQNPSPTTNCKFNPEPRNFFSSAADSNKGPVLQTSLDETNTSTESSMLSNPSLFQLEVDEQGFIKPYIDFEPYYEALDKCMADGSIKEPQMHLYK